MTGQKPVASLSLDLDNKWSYMKTHGDPNWVSYPSYLDIVVPRILKLLKEEDLKITFFIVGQDAAIESNQPALKSIADAGHEIGNHSFKHEPWMQLYTPQEVEDELSKTEAILESVTGQKTIGFRAPGYSISDDVLNVLSRRGYTYDCSTFPTYLGSLARAYYFMTSKLTEEQKADRQQLFGTFRDGRRTNKTYWVETKDRRMIEIPVTTFPVFKTPFHTSYVLYISAYSRFLALAYFRMAMLTCRATGIQPSILLNPLDFLGVDDNQPEMAFFPAMNLPAEPKIEVVRQALRIFKQYYDVCTMRDHVVSAEKDTNLVSPYPLLGLR